MSEALAKKITVGDEVRVHFHPPGSMKSFSEGVVTRVDVTTREGRFFVVDVRHEVILDREHRIRPGFQDYVLYECRNDFPGRIEILSTADQDVNMEPAPSPAAAEAPQAVTQDTHEPSAPEPDSSRETEAEPTAEVDADAEPFRVDLERQPVRRQGGLIAALFRRRK